MALRVRDVRCDPIADRALTGLMHDYSVAEDKNGLILTKKSGNMTLFFNQLDDLHQWEFVQNKIMARQSERLRVLLTAVHQQRESWKIRALMAEAQLLEATTRTGNNGRGKPAGDARYASLKRYLAKQFHPDFAIDRASRRSCATRFSRKSGARSSASTKASRLRASRVHRHLRLPDRATNPSAQRLLPY